MTNHKLADFIVENHISLDDLFDAFKSKLFTQTDEWLTTPEIAQLEDTLEIVEEFVNVVSN